SAGPLSLHEVVCAAIAETEDLDRVQVVVDEQRPVAARAVADLTHLLAEVVENAVRFSPPDSVVTVRSRPGPDGEGRLVTVEDRGVGLPASALADANEVLTAPPELDLSVSQRLGLHVVARLAARHRVVVRLDPGTDSGTVCAISLPEGLFDAGAPVAVENATKKAPAKATEKTTAKAPESTSPDA